MKRTILAGLAGLLMCTGAMAQSFGDIYTKQMPDNQKVNYTYLNESDVIWSKRLYRIIDLREKMNLNLYYPSLKYDAAQNRFTSEMSDGRMNFSGILLNEILSGRVPATDGDAMTVPTTYNDIAAKMNRDTLTIAVVGADGLEHDSTVTNMENPADIKQLMLLEEWFFDKKHSRLDVRIIGICPIYMGYDPITSRLVKRRLFPETAFGFDLRFVGRSPRRAEPAEPHAARGDDRDHRVAGVVRPAGLDGRGDQLAGLHLGDGDCDVRAVLR